MQYKKSVSIFVALICFILCFAVTLQFKSVIRNKSLNSDQLKRNNDLQTELINMKKENIKLQKENMQLSTDLDSYRDEISKKSDGSTSLKKDLDNARMLAGLTDVEGSGVTVTISDSTETVDKSEDYTSYIVHDSDIRDIVNELCTAGGEAISVNGERVIATSSIRCVGNTILVNNKKCASPFVIKAIGDTDTLYSALNMRDGIIDVLKLYKININVTKSSKIKIDKFSNVINFKYAKTSEEQ